MPKPDVQHEKALFSPRDAAVYLDLSESTLARMRNPASKVKGPPFFRLGGSIKYKQAELDMWVEHNRQALENPANSVTEGKALESGIE